MSIESEIDALVRLRTLDKLLKIIGDDKDKQRGLLSNYFKNYNCDKIFEKNSEISYELSQYVSCEIIKANPDKLWDWELISDCKLKKYIDKEKEKLMNRHKIIESRLEKRIKNGCKYSNSIL
jgi:hypothetical protein